MSKLPYMQFYPKDWLADAALRACSPAARGFWLDLLCLMWDCPRRGVLKTSGHAWDMKEIAAATGNDPRSCQEWLNELLKIGVTKRRKSDGSFVNFRMMRDEKKRRKWREQQRSHRDAAKPCQRSVRAMSGGFADVRSHKEQSQNLEARPVCGNVEKSKPNPEKQIADAQRELQINPESRGARRAFDEGNAQIQRGKRLLAALGTMKVMA